MNKETMDILIRILEKIIDRQNTIVKRLEILEIQNMLLNSKIDILKNRQCKTSCKGCGKCSK